MINCVQSIDNMNGFSSIFFLNQMTDIEEVFHLKGEWTTTRTPNKKHTHIIPINAVDEYSTSILALCTKLRIPPHSITIKLKSNERILFIYVIILMDLLFFLWVCGVCGEAATIQNAKSKWPLWLVCMRDGLSIGHDSRVYSIIWRKNESSANREYIKWMTRLWMKNGSTTDRQILKSMQFLIRSMIIRTNLIKLTNCSVIRHGCIFAIQWDFRMNRSDDMAQRSEPMRNGYFSIFMFFFVMLFVSKTKYLNFFNSSVYRSVDWLSNIPETVSICGNKMDSNTTTKMPFTFHSLCAALFIVDSPQCCARCASLSTQFEMITELICITNPFGFLDSNKLRWIKQNIEKFEYFITEKFSITGLHWTIRISHSTLLNWIWIYNNEHRW